MSYSIETTLKYIRGDILYFIDSSIEVSSNLQLVLECERAIWLSIEG